MIEPILRDPIATISLLFVCMFLCWALVEGFLQILGQIFKIPALGWVLLPSNPLKPDYALALKAPTLERFPNYLMGTNLSGESILSRILYAEPHDIFASLVVVCSAIIIGSILGIISGYFGGWLEEIVMRITDIFLSVPALLLAIMLGVLVGHGYFSALLALIVVWWPTYARLFRAQTLSIKSRGFVEAAQLSNTHIIGILFRHIFPNTIDPVIAVATLDFGNVILAYSSLAFLGIAVQPPYPEWGAMSADGLSNFPQNWWWSIFPAIAIVMVATAFSLLGDRLQDIISGRQI
ncbi:peptide ABC transporter permease [Candidatus Marsarchaeota G2 archaeon BE_D]|uniref:Peptide ABC transporter permease n=1 Tax=Candidatus Marsarchaeota G2 archaeon BE_D TaxID=1978158 RepID=A0A2R6CDP4_9ARCH|nr:MAG: peptide ABC transporter permease [Candidatus Marsarchaeota G2 archaeon BE_D]